MSQADARSMEHDPHVVDGAAEYLADGSCRQIVHLAQLEHFTILRRQSSQAFPKCRSRLTSRHKPIRRNRRVSPRSIGIEACLERVIERLRQLFSRMSAPALVRLTNQDSKQPGAHLGSALEPLNRFQERQEYILREILRVASRKAHSPGRSIEPAAVLVDDLPERDRVAGAQCVRG